ncbi:unnamed protein product [Bursaphelenchus xylophilus]|uniref:(pine wood nematode) hypothetical protein n=1 Tax=Bursaphelenchus xylophilus TaxID=6326 RepID=A0A1I7S096_BURXY|nr:unnamed protein product [Bursaphelenchus xylophilus]CAG9108938.1 unnamed protein product [Bursaphelenchus xylophilus]
MAQYLDDLFELIHHPTKQVALKAFDIMLKMNEDQLRSGLLADNAKKAKEFFTYFSKLDIVTESVLDVLTEATGTPELAKLAVNEDKLVRKVLALARHGETKEFVLPMTQISRNAPNEFHQKLYSLVGNYNNLLHDTFHKCEGGKNNPIVLLNVAYVFMNVTQSKEACLELFGDTINALTSYISKKDVALGFKRVVASIILNISCHVETHPLFLDDPHVLCDILDPFADEDYEIDDEEMDKLPLNLQYVDHKRSNSTELLDTLIEILAQLCSTKDGRRVLRHMHIYIILREFDKSQRKDEPKVEGKFLTLEGTPEWNLLMNTLLFDDAELRAPEDEELSRLREVELKEIKLEELDRELQLIESELEVKKKGEPGDEQYPIEDPELKGDEAAKIGPGVSQDSVREKKRKHSSIEGTTEDSE